MEHIHGRSASSRPLKGCVSSLATGTHAGVARRGGTKLLLLAAVTLVERAAWERTKRRKQVLQSLSAIEVQILWSMLCVG